MIAGGVKSPRWCRGETLGRGVPILSHLVGLEVLRASVQYLGHNPCWKIIMFSVWLSENQMVERVLMITRPTCVVRFTHPSSPSAKIAWINEWQTGSRAGPPMQQVHFHCGLLSACIAHPRRLIVSSGFCYHTPSELQIFWRHYEYCWYPRCYFKRTGKPAGEFPPSWVFCLPASLLWALLPRVNLRLPPPPPLQRFSCSPCL